MGSQSSRSISVACRMDRTIIARVRHATPTGEAPLLTGLSEGSGHGVWGRGGCRAIADGDLGKPWLTTAGRVVKEGAI